MKNILILIVCLFAYNSFAKTTEVDVLSAEFGVEDESLKKSLCLTVIRLPANGELIGVVEHIQDCFYARLARRAQRHTISIELGKLKTFSDTSLERHLQNLDGQLRFLFSEGE